MCVNVSDASHVVATVTVDDGATPAAILTTSACVAVAVTTDGTHSVVVDAVDAAGNAAAPVAASWIVDTVPPVHTSSLAPDTCHTIGNVTACNGTATARFLVACDGDGSATARAPCTVQWQLTLVQVTPPAQDCSATAASTSRLLHSDVLVGQHGRGLADDWSESTGGQVTPGGTVDGLYAFVTRAVDAAGNVGGERVQQYWIDSVVPAAPTLSNTPTPVTFTAAVTFTLQLLGDTSPGQSSFWYTLSPPLLTGGGRELTQVPQLPVPNSAAVLLTLTVDQKDVPHTLSVYTVDQAGLVSRNPTPFSWTVASTGAPLV